jgi:hypothetical protein
MDSNESEKITNKLNDSGIPFQGWCFDVIRNLKLGNLDYDFRAVSEYPFTHPSSNGPLLGKPGTIDILSAVEVNGLDDCILLMVFECKRANDKIKNWIFLSDKIGKMPVFVYSDIDSELSDTKKLILRGLTFPELDYSKKEDFDYCYQAVEVNSKLNEWNRSQDEKVYKAMEQANRGVVALENKNPKYIEGLTTNIDLSKFKHFIYLPIVVTTANLYLAEFDYSDIDSGNIAKDKAKYTSRGCVTFDFPLPDFLSYGAEKKGFVIEKRTTFIVNDKYLEKFLRRINIMKSL